MKELNGIWWTIDQNQSLGKLTITDENEIILITDKKLYETNLVDEMLDGNYSKVETLMNKKSNALYDNLKFDTYERFKEFRKF